jgi:hypothetical protein
MWPKRVSDVQEVDKELQWFILCMCVYMCDQWRRIAQEAKAHGGLAIGPSDDDDDVYICVGIYIYVYIYMYVYTVILVHHYN